MAKFKPQVSYITRESREDYYQGRLKSMTLTRQFNTYRELKKELRSICEVNIDADGVYVLRSRRAEWGEWFEYWDIGTNDKLFITKKGWN